MTTQEELQARMVCPTAHHPPPKSWNDRRKTFAKNLQSLPEEEKEERIVVDCVE